MKKSLKEQSLENIIHDIFWMARRYAHGRYTYAPSIIREAYRKLEGMGINIKKDPGDINPPDESQIGGWSFREDYLDDINL